MVHENTTKLKPFLKWAGGKTRLLTEIKKRMPFSKDKTFTYIEPFTGSGAVLFWVLSNFKNLNKVVINDINADLVNVYLQVKSNANELIFLLEKWQDEYHKIDTDEVKKKSYYYQKRTLFNARESTDLVQAALLIFLNRTCFNGLYRVNRSNEFNVPIGSYKKPMIADVENLRRAAESLQHRVILSAGFEETISLAAKNTFFYFDPPYKPINRTSSFNSYSANEFSDSEQVRLKEFCDVLHEKGYKWLLSNSDPVDANGVHFFDELYKGYRIERVKASRNINSKGDKRGKLDEVLIRNY